MTSRLTAAALLSLAALAAQTARAETIWNWQYTGAGIEARGILTASDAADAAGFHQITAITGQRNGDAITGLYPTGMAIPGNEPYALDNLIRLGPTGQITVHGFGFSMASGGHANPYFADFLSPPAYMEVLTAGSGFSEVPIAFTASTVPESEGLLLTMTGLATLGLATSLRRRRAA